MKKAAYRVHKQTYPVYKQCCAWEYHTHLERAEVTQHAGKVGCQGRLQGDIGCFPEVDKEEGHSVQRARAEEYMALRIPAKRAIEIGGREGEREGETKREVERMCVYVHWVNWKKLKTHVMATVIKLLL